MTKWEAVKKGVPAGCRAELLHLQGLWDRCLDSKWSVVEALSEAVHLVDDGTLSRIAAMWLHKTKVLDKFEKYVVTYALGGSWVRGTAKQDSDVDLFIVIDDTDLKRMSRQELKAKLHGIIGEQLRDVLSSKSLKIPFNFQTYLLTDFWDGLRTCNPIFYTFVRDGVPLYDRGLFTPWRLLLKMGKIRPSPAAVEMYYDEGEKQLRRAKDHLRDVGMEDVFYAVVTTVQAALMALMVPPPAPRELAGVAEDLLDKRHGLIDDEHIETIRQAVELRKRLEHDGAALPDHAELQGLMSRAEKLVETLRTIRSRAEALGQITALVSRLPAAHRFYEAPQEWQQVFGNWAASHSESRASAEAVESAGRDLVAVASVVRERHLNETEQAKLRAALRVLHEAMGLALSEGYDTMMNSVGGDGPAYLQE